MDGWGIISRGLAAGKAGGGMIEQIGIAIKVNEEVGVGVEIDQEININVEAD
jgi:hypothetical protein